MLSIWLGSSIIITAFSVRHKLKVLPLQKFSETDATFFQVKLKSVFDTLSFQINFERAVSWRWVTFLKDCLWLLYLVLKAVLQLPMILILTRGDLDKRLVRTVASYTTRFCKHFPFKGQVSFLRQLQLFSAGLFFRVRLLGCDNVLLLMGEELIKRSLLFC